jgi:hypothetical protein
MILYFIVHWIHTLVIVSIKFGLHS